MAGCYFHLWLGDRIWHDPAFQSPEGPEEESRRAFLAGCVGPDLGFFPRGPARLSERLHREHSGDLLRALLAAARSPAEVAFAAGWGLHLCTDQVVHPWVNEQARALFSQAATVPEGDAELWHMRLEWGIDCRLLAREELRHLWAPDLAFPRRPDGSRLLAEVGRHFYGEDARPASILRGEAATERWLRRLPRLLFWCGKIRPGPWKPAPWWSAWLDRITASLLGDRLADSPAWRTPSALAKPWLAPAAVPALIESLAKESLSLFRPSWEERFASFPNLDMAEGVRQTGGRDR